MNRNQLIRKIFSVRCFLFTVHRRAQRGVTLIDTVVGSALMLVVFLGIGAVFQLSVDVVTNNKARAGAIALANERVEYVRSLEYSQIGTVGGIPAGAIAPTETVSLNGHSYTRRTYIEYADDPGDGTGASDSNGITVDYKAVRVDIAWSSRIGQRHIALVTRVEPQNGMEVSCSVPCGTLSIAVVNALNQPVYNAAVRIVNSSTVPTVDITTYTNTSGVADLVGAPAAANYQVTVSKSGYNSAQTYSSSAQNPNPNPGHLAVSQNQITSATFAIDLVSTKVVQTFNAPAPNSWEDLFSDANQLAVLLAAEVSGGRIRFSGNPPFPDTAEAESVSFSPAGLTSWKELSWHDSEPTDTIVTYRLYYQSGGSFVPVPDSALPGNAAGFTSSPVDLMSIPVADYPFLRIHAVLFTLNPDPGSPRPSIDDWKLAYEYSGSLSGVSFNMRGEKTIGNGPPSIFKYNATSTSDGYGSATLANIEWDTYTTSVYPSTGYDLASVCYPQPEYLAPGISTTTRLYLAAHTPHSLAVEVRSQANGALLGSAFVNLSRTGYSATSSTDGCGQTFFGGLVSGEYSYTISKQGYQATSSATAVSGNGTLKVNLQ